MYVNDSTCPVQLHQLRLLPIPVSSEEHLIIAGPWRYAAVGSITVGDQAIAALDLGILPFDEWGDMQMPLRISSMIDLPARFNFPIDGGSWSISEETAHELFTSVAYMRHVKLAAGQIWTADFEAVNAKVQELHLDAGNAISEKQPEGRTTPGAGKKGP